MEINDKIVRNIFHTQIQLIQQNINLPNYLQDKLVNSVLSVFYKPLHETNQNVYR